MREQRDSRESRERERERERERGRRMRELEKSRHKEEAGNCSTMKKKTAK